MASGLEALGSDGRYIGFFGHDGVLSGKGLWDDDGVESYLRSCEDEMIYYDETVR